MDIVPEPQLDRPNQARAGRIDFRAPVLPILYRRFPRPSTRYRHSRHKRQATDRGHQFVVYEGISDARCARDQIDADHLEAVFIHKRSQPTGLSLVRSREGFESYR